MNNRAPGELKWQVVAGDMKLFRSAVPGGWLVVLVFPLTPVSITFYPDPTHVWDGSSVAPD